MDAHFQFGKESHEWNVFTENVTEINVLNETGVWFTHEIKNSELKTCDDYILMLSLAIGIPLASLLVIGLLICICLKKTKKLFIGIPDVKKTSDEEPPKKIENVYSEEGLSKVIGISFLILNKRLTLI